MNVPLVMLLGLVPDEPVADRRMMLPALSPVPLFVALVLIAPTLTAVDELLPLEIKTLPPSAVVEEPLAVAWALMFPVICICPEPTSETEPAAPLRPVASVVMFPVICIPMVVRLVSR